MFFNSNPKTGTDPHFPENQGQTPFSCFWIDAPGGTGLTQHHIQAVDFTLLEKAFAEAAKLPADQQDAFAQFVLEELRSDERWGRAFAASQDDVRWSENPQHPSLHYKHADYEKLIARLRKVG